MITVIDTNILIDIFGAASSQTLKQCLQEGTIFACEIVWAETATAFKDRKSFLLAMQTLSIEFSPMTQEMALIAAEAWCHYRKISGKKHRILADFLIGAHALIHSDRLLTRDRGFYRNYFKSLKIISP